MVWGLRLPYAGIILVRFCGYDLSTCPVAPTTLRGARDETRHPEPTYACGSSHRGTGGVSHRRQCSALGEKCARNHNRGTWPSRKGQMLCQQPTPNPYLHRQRGEDGLAISFTVNEHDDEHYRCGKQDRPNCDASDGARRQPSCRSVLLRKDLCTAEKVTVVFRTEEIVAAGLKPRIAVARLNGHAVHLPLVVAVVVGVKGMRREPGGPTGGDAMGELQRVTGRGPGRDVAGRRRGRRRGVVSRGTCGKTGQRWARSEPLRRQKRKTRLNRRPRPSLWSRVLDALAVEACAWLAFVEASLLNKEALAGL